MSTPSASIHQLEASWASEAVAKQRAYFESGATRSYEFRMTQLRKMKKSLIRYQQEAVDALKSDIGRPPFEAYIEIVSALEEVNHCLKSLKKWMKPKKAKTALMAQPGFSRIEYTPLGVAFIMGPYNYPYMLTLQPVIGAIAAGCTMIVKPSSLNPGISSLIKRICEENYSDEYVKVYEGSTEVTNVLLEEKFDHIFFTGSPRVGKIIMASAAKHLTPVTLELGGKSPTIIHHDANIKTTAKRIVSGKFLNAGQTCVAPDHLYVHKLVKGELISEMKKCIKSSYGSDTKASPDFGRIINEKHWERVTGLIDQDKVIAGGESDREQKFIAPTLMDNATMDDAAMQEEIFGPVLPIMEYETLSEVYDKVKQLPSHPLACYLFTTSKRVEKDVLDNIQFGGGCINNTIMHVGNGHMPFGGVGESGMGSYHGHQSFKVFSHERSILSTPASFDLPLRYAPYKGKVKLFKMMMR